MRFAAFEPGSIAAFESGRRVPRRFSYAALGGLVSLGAPAGLLGIRVARRQWSVDGVCQEVRADREAYTYVAISTALAFITFGYAIGRAADRLAALSETDELTGLTNARGFFDRLDKALARVRRHREPLALLLVDLDGLKEINDRYGHRAGDEAIRRLADVIRSELRESDVGARWGGDEFAILAPRTSPAAALALAERVRAAIPERTAPWTLTGSIGVAAIDTDAAESADGATLMRAADAALYEAKGSGKDRAVIAPAFGR